MQASSCSWAQSTVATFLATIALASSTVAGESLSGDWPQWRGPARNGVASQSPELIEALPVDGMPLLWKSEPIPGGNNGGWGSPVVAAGKLYVLTHVRTPSPEGSLAERKYPALNKAEEARLSPEELAQYDVNRKAETQELRKHDTLVERIFCLDAADGATLWKRELPSVHTRFPQAGTPTISGGKLLYLGAGLLARCLDAATGDVLWETRLPGEFNHEHEDSSFAVADGVAVILAGRMIGLDIASGAVLWEGDPNTTGGHHSSPAIWKHAGQEYVIANVAGGDTSCFDPRDGTELWHVESSARLSTPVISNDKLIVYGDNRAAGLRCYTMSLDGAKPDWMYRRIADRGSSPIVLDGYVYVQGERRLACVDLETGDEAWATDLDLNNPRFTSLIAADGKLFYTHDGVLCVLAKPDAYQSLFHGKMNAAGLLASEALHREQLGLNSAAAANDSGVAAAQVFDREITRRGPLDCASPAIVDGRLYLRTSDAMVCYDLTKHE